MKTIFRTELNSDFTVLPNAALRDVRLSFKARGILAMVLSHKDTWEVNRGWLESQGTEGREAVKSALDELKKLGYCRMDREFDPVSGRVVKWVWIFYDTDGHFDPDDGNPSCGSARQPQYGYPYSRQHSEELSGTEELCTKVEQKLFDDEALSGDRDVLRHLNSKSKVQFREIPSNLRIIASRLKEKGVDVAGCKKMIDRQVERWAGTEFEEYLRPSTLFRPSKFNGYYAAKDLPAKNGISTQASNRNAGTFNNPNDYADVP